MGNIGMWEIIGIAIVVLLLFGAKRLPEVGASIGKGIQEFKNSLKDTQDAIMHDDPDRTSSLPPRRMDAPGSTPQSGGEPKRLSQ